MLAAGKALISGKFVYRWFIHMNQSRGLLLLRYVIIEQIALSWGEEENRMKKLALTLGASVLVFAALALPAGAQTEQRGAASIFTLRNATPIVKQAACNGTTGYCGCGPGWVSACAPRCCRCVPCY
jgi:hypothetical protein